MKTTVTRHENRANAIFAKEFNGSPNFMTPYVIKRGMFGTLAWELSSGSGMLGTGTLYGVTCLRQNDDGTITRENDLGDSFYSNQQAIDYINSLDQ